MFCGIKYIYYICAYEEFYKAIHNSCCFSCLHDYYLMLTTEPKFQSAKNSYSCGG